MRKVLFRAFFLLSSAGSYFLPALAFSQQKASRLKFTEETHLFDTLREGLDKTHRFVFTNTGAVPLSIRAFTNCGCTVAEVPVAPVLPGKEGAVSVTYHTEGRPGPFMQTIFLQVTGKEETVNNQEEYLLKIAGVVAPGRKP